MEVVDVALEVVIVKSFVSVDQSELNTLAASGKLVLVRTTDQDLNLDDLILVIDRENGDNKIARVVAFKRLRRIPAKAAFKVVLAKEFQLPKRILFGAQAPDFMFSCAAHIEALETAGYEVLEFSVASSLLEAMVSGEGDLVILFGGPMSFGRLQHHEDTCNHFAGFAAVAAAREQGCEMPVLVLETLQPPSWALELPGILFTGIPHTLDDFERLVEKLISGKL